MSTHASTFSEEGRWAKNPHDFYQTPKELVFALLSFVPGNPQRILDVGAGKGVWGEAARSIWPDAQITGIELQDFPQPSAYDCWLANTDFLTWKPDHNFDLVMGNPPYSVQGTQHGAGKIARKGYRLLADGGTQLLLLKTEFLNGQWRYEHLWPKAPWIRFLSPLNARRSTAMGILTASSIPAFCGGKPPSDNRIRLSSS